MTKRNRNTLALMFGLLFLVVLFLSHHLMAQHVEAIKTSDDALLYLPLPERASTALTGSAFAQKITGLSIEEREKKVVKEILAGNVPSFARKLKRITIQKTISSKNYALTFYADCDYLAIGSDKDYLYMPMTPSTAQYLADRLNCTLPTKKMVDLIYAHAEIKLRPQPIPPSDRMTTVPVFVQHTDSIKAQIAQLHLNRTADSIFAGHKKDIIISNKIYTPDRDYERVVIYGWHRSIGDPIQPVYNGHYAGYADYSHGVRLVWNRALLNGDTVKITELLKDEQLNVLLSDEGPIAKPYYPPSDIFTEIKESRQEWPMHFRLFQNFPNPFNPQTQIHYVLKQPTLVRLTVFDELGRCISVLVNQNQQAGDYRILFNSGPLAAGTYYYTLQSGPYAQTRKMVVVK